YEISPGMPIYAFGTPLFKEVKYHLENGKTFTIRAPNVLPANMYIQSATLNGQPYRKAFISHSDLMNGGVLEFQMADHPFMTAFDQFPITGNKTNSVAVPVIDGGGARAFSDRATITISTIVPGAKIMYGTDRTDPPWMPYTGPFTIGSTTRIFAKTVAA